ncbi:MAG TPA: AraC family transcriptional regulator [Puia sp.]
MFDTQSFRPDPLLREVVDRYQLVKEAIETPYAEYCFLPKVSQQISFNLGPDKSVYDLDNQDYISSCNLIGQNDRICRIRIYNGMSRLIVNLKSLGWYKLFRIPAPRFINRSCNLQHLLGNEIQLLHQQLLACNDFKKQIQLLDTFFMKRLFQQEGHYKNIEGAVHRILELKGNISINRLEKEVFITRRTLERHFLEQTGLFPKMFARITRFSEAIKYLEKNLKPNWPYLINCLGYCDQSHFINEFQHFAGCPPTHFYDQRVEFETAGLS